MENELKRKTLKLCQPNPLFEKWLEEWKNEAASRNSDTQYAFAKALASLKKYPLLLKTGKECMILEHFGPRICLLLDRKLADYKNNHPKSFGCDNDQQTSVKEIVPANVKKPTKNPNVLSSSSSDDGNQKSQEKENVTCKEKKRKISPVPTKTSPSKKINKLYIPTLRSSSYAVLVALNLHLKNVGPPGEMTKEELQRAAQPLCDMSMLKPLPGSSYSGWSCVGQLVGKGLVQRRGNPHRFSLSEDGINLAVKLPIMDMNISKELQNILPKEDSTQQLTVKNKKVRKDRNNSKTNIVAESCQQLIQCKSDTNLLTDGDSQSQSSSATSLSNHEEIILLQGQFEIFLLIDTQEIHRGDELVNAIEALGVKLGVRKLKVGDFAWVSRNSKGQELLLPFIIERKRLDDLASSIKDGRFHEQKFRMKQSGVPNCMYLVEGHGHRQFSLPISTLMQAAINTEYVERFSVKYTENFHETVAYLATFTKVITRKFIDKTLIGCHKSMLPEFNIEDDCISLMTFGEFNKLSGKTRKYTVKEMFIKQLVQLRGLSVEKALAIVERYPTPRSLVTAFGNEGNERFISDITVGNLNRKIGPSISKSVYELYNKSALS